MIENELKRIADALEAIAIAIQPVGETRPLTTAAVDVDPVPQAPAKKAKATPKVEKPEVHVPVLAEAVEIPGGDVKVLTTDEIVALVQKAVKVNRDATLAVCRKFGYTKSLKDIKEDNYTDLAAELEGVK